MYFFYTCLKKFLFLDFESLQASDRAVKNVNQRIESLPKIEAKFNEIQNVLEENKETLRWLQNQNEYLTESLHELRIKQGDKCELPLHTPVQHRGFCYFRTLKMNSWRNCSHLCDSLNATFLMTERNKSMIIMNLLAVNHTWIGLSYKKEKSKWMWEDGSLPSSDMSSLEPSLDISKCAYVMEHTTKTADCSQSFSCACVKKAL
ncbi:natural killer cells antigen CD94-like [Erinaceus europaeus]|uniref:Natural killer cells antigen CD94-like n=1 Tax=Erinaceus europaeus TaxID=9365 RepID=A0ABM3XL01_ERIEU|nr:natural killer cells antigen CD94-like [Erinaceus europaeus]